MTLHRNMLDRIHKLSAARAESSQEEILALNEILRAAAKHRAHLLQQTVIQRIGLTISSGPFSGMTFVPSVTEGCHVPKLLGCYESELHPHLERLFARGYEHIVNVGCAEGYYAVGCARRLPQARIHAFDIDVKGQTSCRKLAEQNGVSDRVSVGGELRREGFREFPEGKTLVLCDIEGAEFDLLDPSREPALLGFDFLVELHPSTRDGAAEALLHRFAATHKITRVPHRIMGVDLPPLFDELALGHLDRLLAIWEWRASPTPWAVIERN